MKKSTIEILFSDQCPYVKVAINRVLEILSYRDPAEDVELKLVHVENLDDATRRHFLGSPTIRVDGRDVDRSLRTVTGFGLSDRAYAVDGRLERVPPESWIARALGIRIVGFHDAPT